MNDLNCPKCVTPMRSMERNGVTIERCGECGGIFLDRGELERLLEAESQYVATATADAPAARDLRNPAQGPHRIDNGESHRESGHGERGHNDDGRPGRKKKRGGFLGDLLDFGGD